MLATTVNVPSWLIPGLILLMIGAVVTIVTRAVFKSFREWIKDWFEDILAEIKPNGGNTNKLGDQVVQAKAAIERVEQGVSGLYPRVDAIETEQARVRNELLEHRGEFQHHAEKDEAVQATLTAGLEQLLPKP